MATSICSGGSEQPPRAAPNRRRSFHAVAAGRTAYGAGDPTQPAALARFRLGRQALKILADPNRETMSKCAVQARKERSGTSLSMGPTSSVDSPSLRASILLADTRCWCRCMEAPTGLTVRALTSTYKCSRTKAMWFCIRIRAGPPGMVRSSETASSTNGRATMWTILAGWILCSSEVFLLDRIGWE